jgi:hypothetical protein
MMNNIEWLAWKYYKLVVLNFKRIVYILLYSLLFLNYIELSEIEWNIVMDNLKVNKWIKFYKNSIYLM